MGSWAGDQRRVALSAHAYLAAFSRLLQSTERSGTAQLTWDDAIHYNHGMRMERPTFDQKGNRYLGQPTFDQKGNSLLPEATQAERENMCRYNWLIREGHPTAVKADLAAVCDQIDKWPVNREVARTIPQINFAEGTGLNSRYGKEK